MAKVTLTDVVSGYSTKETINANNAAVEAAVENTLSRDGTSPNQMGANLDMNSNRILNLPTAVNDSEPVTLAQAASITGVTNPLTQSTAGAALYPQTTGEAAAGVTPTYYYYPPGNVLRYGAAGDGSTDDTTAFQAALDSSTYVTVPAPPSSYYKITDTLTLSTGTKVIGEAGLPRIVFSGSMAADNLFLASSVSNIVIENLTLEGDQSADANSPYGAGIQLSSVTGARVNNNKIRAFPRSGVSVRAGSDIFIEKNRIDDIDNATTSGSAVGGINIEDACDSIWITDNNITNIGIQDGNGIGIRMIEQTGGQGSPTRFHVNHNLVEDCQTHGILIYNGTSFTDTIASEICANTVRRVGLATTGTANQLGCGIYSLSNYNIDISNNFIDYACQATGSSSIARAGIAAMAETTLTIKGINIQGNIIKNSGTDGIRMQHGEGCIINDNVIDTWAVVNAAGIGIFLSNGSDAADGQFQVSCTGNQWRGSLTEEMFVHGNSTDAPASSDCYVEVLSAPIRTSYETPFVRNYGTGLRMVVRANAVPTGGTWATGDRAINEDPGVNGIAGWVCTAAAITFVPTHTVGGSSYFLDGQNSDYEIALADVDKVIHADGTTVNYTCMDDSTIPNGSKWLIVNEGTGAISILQDTGVTIRLFDGGGSAPSTGTRTLARAGVATIVKYTDTEYWIWGQGLT